MKNKEQIKQKILAKVSERYKIDSYRKVVETICDIAIDEVLNSLKEEK